MSHFTADDHLDGGDGNKPRRRSTGRLYGARNYSKQMVTTLLDSVENILPIEQEEWQTVADQFNYHFHDNRQVKSIRRKYMDMVNDRKTTAANAPEEIRRAKTLHSKIMLKRRAHPNLDKIHDDIDDDSSASSANEEDGYGELQARVNEYASTPSAVPVANNDVSSNQNNNRITRLGSQKYHNPLFRDGDNVDTTNPIVNQLVKLLQLHHEQYDLPFQQQLLEQLQIVQRQNQEILDALSNQKSASGSKKRARENEDNDGI